MTGGKLKGGRTSSFPVILVLNNYVRLTSLFATKDTLRFFCVLWLKYHFAIRNIEQSERSDLLRGFDKEKYVSGPLAAEIAEAIVLPNIEFKTL